MNYCSGKFSSKEERQSVLESEDFSMKFVT